MISVLLHTQSDAVLGCAHICIEETEFSIIFIISHIKIYNLHALLQVY